MERLISQVNKTSELLDNCTYRAKVERYGTEAAKAVLASHDAALQLIKEITVARRYGSGGWGSAQDLDNAVAQVTNQEKIDVLQGMVDWYGTHELIKGTHLQQAPTSTGTLDFTGGCAEGAASCVMSQHDDPTGRDSFSRMMGVGKPGKWEIAANATIDWLRDELGPELGMSKEEDLPDNPGRFIWDVQNNNPLAVFNDDPKTTKAVMVSFLQRKIYDLECEIEIGHLGGKLGNTSYASDFYDGPALIGNEAPFTPEPSLAESE